MKIRLFSDMHIEFNDGMLDIPELPTDKETVLILAGDIGEGLTPVLPIKRIADRFKHVLYVAGNHEYYNQNMMVHRYYLYHKAFENTNVTFLDNKHAEIDGIRFIGGTAWTDMSRGSVDEWHDRYTISHSMNDFYTIRDTEYDTLWTPDKAAREHDYFLDELNLAIETARTNKLPLFVITHHAPSALSVEDKYKNNVLNAAYHSNLDDYITNNTDTIKWWVHGHMHHSVSYNIGDTNIFSNPYGYHSHEVNPNYQATKVWEIN